MADVFISYAREDAAVAERLAAALAAWGLSVWWDRSLRSGQDWQAEIERELEAAACVVVIWSRAGVASQPVRAEASAALERQALTPIRIDAAAPPLFFRTVHHEDFEGWSGDQTAAPFRRLLVQAVALARGEAAAQALDFSAPPAGGAPEAAPGAPAVDAAPAAGRPDGRLGSALTLLGLLAGAAALLVSPEEVLGDYWAFVLGLAGLAIALFQFAEKDLNPRVKALARRWLLPRKQDVELGSGQAFLLLFEAVFTQRHFSWACFLRSALASVIGFAIIILFFYISNIGRITFDIEAYQIPYLVIVVISINVLGDYVSLWQTRAFLRLADGPRMLLIVIADFFATTFVYYAFLVVSSVVLAFAIRGVDETLADLDGLLGFLIRLPGGVAETIFNAGSSNVTSGDLFVATTVLTTFLTSVWLWLALVFTPLFRALAWSRTTGVTLLGRFFDVRRAPFAALGYVTAALILIGGLAVWSVERALAATAPAPIAAPAE